MYPLSEMDAYLYEVDIHFIKCIHIVKTSSFTLYAQFFHRFV